MDDREKRHRVEIDALEVPAGSTLAKMAGMITGLITCPTSLSKTFAMPTALL